MTDFRGIYTPLISPLGPNEGLDLKSLKKLVAFQIENGVGGLWAMGTTGEFAAFDEVERHAAIQCVVEATGGRVPVIANVSDAATRLVLRHVRRAESAGATAIAATPPYYYPHSQTELLNHYRAIAAATSLPVFIYNIPQTVRVSLTVQTVLTLMREGAVVGIKDSQNDLEWFRELTLVASDTAAFHAFAGTRHLIDAAVLAGAVGAIPSIANSHPALCVATFNSAVAGDFKHARESQSEIVEIESRLSFTRGSRNAATIGSIKGDLLSRGIIADAGLTMPLLVD